MDGEEAWGGRCGRTVDHLAAALEGAHTDLETVPTAVRWHGDEGHPLRPHTWIALRMSIEWAAKENAR